MSVFKIKIMRENQVYNILRPNEALLDNLKFLICLEKLLFIVYDVFTVSVIFFLIYLFCDFTQVCGGVQVLPGAIFSLTLTVLLVYYD